MIPPSSPFYDQARKAPARDVAKAKAMIAAAGMTRVPVELSYENTAGDARVAQIMQSMAGEAGFDVKLLPMETTTAIERYLNGNFEAYIGNWSGRADPDPTLVAFFSCAGSQNVNKYCNKDLDAILIAGPRRGRRSQAQGALRQGDRHLPDGAVVDSAVSPELVLCCAQIRRRHRHGTGWPVASGRRQACELMRNAARPSTRLPW